MPFSHTQRRDNSLRGSLQGLALSVVGVRPRAGDDHDELNERPDNGDERTDDGDRQNQLDDSLSRVAQVEVVNTEGTQEEGKKRGDEPLLGGGADDGLAVGGLTRRVAGLTRRVAGLTVAGLAVGGLTVAGLAVGGLTVAGGRGLGEGGGPGGGDLSASWGWKGVACGSGVVMGKPFDKRGGLKWPYGYRVAYVRHSAVTGPPPKRP